MALEFAVDMGAITALGTLIFNVIKYIRDEIEKKNKKHLQLRRELSAIKDYIVGLTSLEPISVEECETRIVDKLSDCEAQLGLKKNIDKYYLCRDEKNQFVSAFCKYENDRSKRNYQDFLYCAKEYKDVMRTYVL